MTTLAISLTRATRGIDRVALAILAILAALALLAPPQALISLRFTAGSLLDVAPFLLLSVGVAAYAKGSGADNLIESRRCSPWASRCRRSWPSGWPRR